MRDGDFTAATDGDLEFRSRPVAPCHDGKRERPTSTDEPLRFNEHKVINIIDLSASQPDRSQNRRARPASETKRPLMARRQRSACAVYVNLTGGSRDAAGAAPEQTAAIFESVLLPT